MLAPTAVYSAPDVATLEFVPGDEEHSTSGATTKISDVVINAGGEDRDKPSEHKDTPLGHLRAQLTTLQDKVNQYLTERMKSEKQTNDDLERRLLDEGVDEDSE